MVKLVFLAYRKEGMSAEEFQDYWENQHAPLVKSLADSVGIRRYVQTYAIDTPLNVAFSEARGMEFETPPDGIAEAWWDSLEALEEAFAGPDGEKAGATLVEDESKFLDFSRCSAYLSGEREIVAA